MGELKVKKKSPNTAQRDKEQKLINESKTQKIYEKVKLKCKWSPRKNIIGQNQSMFEEKMAKNSPKLMEDIQPQI